mgnify:CR=1 FL=1
MRATISHGFSIWLDALRAGAALAVLLGHFAHTRFTRGDYEILREANIAADAVVVFFVISGLVIAYAAGRDGSLAQFAFNRMTRLLTVVFPALVLTLVFDAAGNGADPSAYAAPYYQDVDPAKLFLRGLSFTNEWTGVFERVRLGSNGPLWSLSYEAAYYVMFAIAIFLRGPVRIVLTALLAYLVGLPVLVLLPVWAMGVLVWHLIRKPGRNAIGGGSAWLLTLTCPLILLVCKALGVDTFLSSLTAQAFAPVSHHAVLLYSDEVAWSLVIAVFFALHLQGMARLLQSADWRADSPPVRLVRFVAGASFSIYVVHYPTLHLLDATLPETLPGYDLVLLGLTLFVCFVFAAFFERPLGFYRRQIRELAKIARPQQVAVEALSDESWFRRAGWFRSFRQ